MMVAGVAMRTVDAVDVLDASFQNLTTVDENQNTDENNNYNATATEGDEDFEAFVCSKRLKEKGELQEAIRSIQNEALTEDKKNEQEKELAELNEDLRKGLEPSLIVTDACHQIVSVESQQVARDPKRFISPKDFDLLKVIGMGAFGKVLQVRTKTTNKILAMKVISKRLLNRKSGYVENIHAERNILTRVRHPFVVMMHAVSVMQVTFISGTGLHSPIITYNACFSPFKPNSSSL
jgi:Protein kinase domain